MEILSSGSFINLDNSEKIEQLIYTAGEIAKKAINTDGYEPNEENNKKLAFDIWEGAEYMCRDSEEVQIKNMFVGSFLERMREISVASKVIDNSLANPETNSKTNFQNNDSNDEYLGLVQTAQEQENADSDIDEHQSIDESANYVEETTKVISATDVENQEVAQTVETSSNEQVISEDVKALDEDETLEQDSTQEILAETIQPTQSETTRKETTQTDSIGAIVLPEKESYQFDKCTVTATIQLLPTDLGIRKVILSVRTHDFAPQISILEMESEATTEQMVAALGESFEKYKADLPVKVMDKMRKEKDGGKKKKRSKKVKSSQQNQTNSTTEVSSSQDEIKTGENTDTVDTSVTIPQTETNLQGSLFGS